jgi:hypothetical protein
MCRCLAACGVSLITLVSLSGCTSLLGLSGIHHTPVDPAAAEQADPPATVQVVLKNKRGNAKQSTLPLTDGMSVQAALEQTGAIRKFKDMEIKVFRVTPLSKGAVVPLQADYDPAKNRVPITHDMALHAGDKILVEECDNSQLQQMLQKLTGNASKRRGLE